MADQTADLLALCDQADAQAVLATKTSDFVKLTPLEVAQLTAAARGAAQLAAENARLRGMYSCPHTFTRTDYRGTRCADCGAKLDV